MFQGMLFWARMARSMGSAQLAPFPDGCATQPSLAWNVLAGWASDSPNLTRPSETLGAQISGPQLQAEAEATFSSYRSSSGHAVAQVIVPAA